MFEGEGNLKETLADFSSSLSKNVGVELARSLVGFESRGRGTLQLRRTSKQSLSAIYFTGECSNWETFKKFYSAWKIVTGQVILHNTN
jgi:hypothetical protein